MQWNTKAGNITANLKVKVVFNLPALIAMNAMTWNFHVVESAKGTYDMLLGRDLLIELGLNLKFSEHATKANDGPLNGYRTPMIDLGTYTFKDLNTGKFTPKESFTNA